MHPRLDEHGNPVPINHPYTPTSQDSWEDCHRTAIAVPDSPMPPEVNAIPIRSWLEAPTSSEGWARLSEMMPFVEPSFDPQGLPSAAGAVAVELDGRVWLIAPTNCFAGTKNTFPKGKTNGRPLRATALKEVFEESGLQVELFDHLVDVTRSTSRTRYYLARRIYGNPADMDWESQAVILAPVGELKSLLHQPYDLLVLEALMKRWEERPSWFPNSTP